MLMTMAIAEIVKIGPRRKGYNRWEARLYFYESLGRSTDRQTSGDLNRSPHTAVQDTCVHSRPFAANFLCRAAGL